MSVLDLLTENSNFQELRIQDEKTITNLEV